MSNFSARFETSAHSYSELKCAEGHVLPDLSPRSVQDTAGGKMQVLLAPYGAEDNGDISRKGNAHS